VVYTGRVEKSKRHDDEPSGVCDAMTPEPPSDNHSFLVFFSATSSVTDEGRGKGETAVAVNPKSGDRPAEKNRAERPDPGGHESNLCAERAAAGVDVDAGAGKLTH